MTEWEAKYLAISHISSKEDIDNAERLYNIAFQMSIGSPYSFSECMWTLICAVNASRKPLNKNCFKRDNFFKRFYKKVKRWLQK